MQEYRTSRVTELNFNVVTWKRDTKNRKVFMPMRHVFDPGFVVGQSDEKGRESNRVEMGTGFRLSIRPRTLPDRLCREKSKKNAEKILATGIRSFEPASTPLRMRDILSVWWTSGLNHPPHTLSYQFLRFLYFDEKYFGRSWETGISWFILVDV